MITCNLTKPESTLDQVKKSYPKLKQTDAALIATSLVLSGRYAQAVYEGETYDWPRDYEGLTQALIRQLLIVQQSIEPLPKRTAKSAVEEEAVEIKVGLVSNYAEGERILAEREDLKTLFSDILSKGVEYQYTSTDIGWQWALDRANWPTASNNEVTRKVKFKATFEGAAVGVEMGLTGPKKRSSRAKAAVVEAPVEAEPVADAELDVIEADAATADA